MASTPPASSSTSASRSASTPASTSASTLGQRLLLAGGFALAAAAVPLAVGLSAPADVPSVASCPPGETLDTASGVCKPGTGQTAATLNPLNPEQAALQPDEITSSVEGDVGELPKVDGIPCTGAGGGGGSTSECIGLEESQGPAFEKPQSSLSSSP